MALDVVGHDCSVKKGLEERVGGSGSPRGLTPGPCCAIYGHLTDHGHLSHYLSAKPGQPQWGEQADQVALAGVLNTLVELQLSVVSVDRLSAARCFSKRREPMAFGPVDFIALEFPGNRFKGEILPDLFELVDKEIIRIIDLVIITKNQDGQVTARELRELDSAHIEIFNPLKAEANQMITDSDIAMIAGQVANNSTAGILLIENLWAKKTQQAMMDANGRLVMFERIPHDVVEEALVDIAALATTDA
jgi:uncharacterized membrane protein